MSRLVVVSGVHVMPSVRVMPRMHVVSNNPVAIVVLATGLAAGVPDLSLSD